jgi:hypothetical protein
MIKRVHSLLIFTALFSGCWQSTSSLEDFAKSPGWYNNLQKSGKEIIGYGQGESEEIAKKRAYSDIANQIGVKVNSEFEKLATCNQNSKLSSSAECKERRSLSSSQKANHLIAGAETFKTQRVKNIYFVALKYRNESFSQGFKRKFQQFRGECLKGVDEVQNSYLLNSKLFQDLERKIGCYPRVTLSEKDAIFFLETDQFSHRFFNLEDLFFTKKSSPVDIKIIDTNGGNIENGDQFDIEITSSENGYVTLLTIYKNGEVYLYEKDIPVKKGKVSSISENSNGFYAGLFEGEKHQTDQIVALFSKNKDSFSTFFAVKYEDNIDEHIEFMKLYKIFYEDIQFTTALMELYN